MSTKWRAEISIMGLLVVMFAMTAATACFIPGKYPIHWNLAGEPDRYAEGWLELFVLPSIAIGVAVILAIAPLIDPGRANFENFARTWTMIRLTIIGFMLVEQAAILWSALGHDVKMQRVMPICLGLLFAILGNYMGKLRPNWTAGIRTPWTLSSRLSWTKTHRQGGWIMMLMGAAIASLSLIQTVWYAVLVITGCIAGFLWLVVYSFLVWRTDPDRIPPGGSLPVHELPSKEVH